ncbi:hypothetical protein MKZ26_03230 [Sporosarcina sp. FSL K6-6792]|uniref:hypothetical protein n=1 Tax=Sporosarcina sp. FSL K6-6792 TaxID=2921559 RepID=UPI0030FABD3B
MSKAKEGKPQQQKYSKSAFVEAAEESKERLILQVILADNKTYTKDEVAKLVEAWKSKKVNAKVEKEKKEVKA